MNFQLIMLGIDVQPLLAQINTNPQLWHTETEWTAKKPQSAIYETENIVLRYNKSSEPYKNDWNRPPLNVLSEAKPIIFDLMKAIQGEHLGKIVITRLKPGEKIDFHIDQMPPGIPLYFQRYQIPLQVSKGVRFIVDGDEQYLEPGTAWWFDNQKMHSVANDSPDDRISMLVDIRPLWMSS